MLRVVGRISEAMKLIDGVVSELVALKKRLPEKNDERGLKAFTDKLQDIISRGRPFCAELKSRISFGQSLIKAASAREKSSAASSSSRSKTSKKLA